MIGPISVPAPPTMTQMMTSAESPRLNRDGVYDLFRIGVEATGEACQTPAKSEGHGLAGTDVIAEQFDTLFRFRAGRPGPGQRVGLTASGLPDRRGRG